MNPVKEAAQIGANRLYQNPNDPALVGTYRDAAAALSPEQKSVMVNMPMAAAPKAYKLIGV